MLLYVTQTVTCTGHTDACLSVHLSGRLSVCSVALHCRCNPRFKASVPVNMVVLKMQAFAASYTVRRKSAVPTKATIRTCIKLRYELAFTRQIFGRCGFPGCWKHFYRRKRIEELHRFRTFCRLPKYLFRSESVKYSFFFFLHMKSETGAFLRKQSSRVAPVSICESFVVIRPQPASLHYSQQRTALQKQLPFSPIVRVPALLLFLVWWNDKIPLMVKPIPIKGTQKWKTITLVSVG